MSRRRFLPLEFFPPESFARITELRVDSPGVPRKMAMKRKRRRRLAPDGKLALLAADHPARMVTAIREDPLRMGRRHELLSRILRVAACSPMDGLLGTADVIDDLFAVESYTKEFLNRKVLVGSLNRGGLAGSSFELDDRLTGYDAEGIVKMRLDGAKFLLRVDLEAPDSLRTIRYCVEALEECRERGVPLFLEPLPVTSSDGKVKVVKDKEKLIRLTGVASGLGSSTSKVWLKLPYCEGFEEVAGSTTLPILLLGGDATDDAMGLLREIETAMKSGPNVRGVLMGRNLLYPAGDDPLPLAAAVSALVHEGAGADEARAEMKSWEGRDLDMFRSND